WHRTSDARWTPRAPPGSETAASSTSRSASAEECATWSYVVRRSGLGRQDTASSHIGRWRLIHDASSFGRCSTFPPSAGSHSQRVRYTMGSASRTTRGAASPATVSTSSWDSKAIPTIRSRVPAASRARSAPRCTRSTARPRALSTPDSPMSSPGMNEWRPFPSAVGTAAPVLLVLGMFIGRLDAAHYAWLGHTACPSDPGSCENQVPAGFKRLGDFDHRVYRALDESSAEWLGEDRTQPLRTREGHIIARVGARFRRQLDVEGSARLRDGRVVNIEGMFNGESRFLVIEHAPFGVGAP